MIIQKASKYKFDKPAIERIKGHTRIELVDTKTRHRKVIESDNTFQADILADKMLGGVFRYGAYDDVPFANGKAFFNSSFTLAELAHAQMLNTVGGIMIFDTEIEVGSKYAPAGVKMVANGGYGVTNSGTPTELGSFNTNESTFGNNAFQMVYDYNTSQGNGNIASICLTSRLGGLIGQGNPSGGASATKYSPGNYQTGAARINNVNAIKYGDFLYDFSPEIDFVNKTLTVNKYTLNGVNKASIFDGRYETLTFTWTGEVGQHSDTAPAVPVTDGNGNIIIPLPYKASTWDHYLPNNTTGYYIMFDANETDPTQAFSLHSVTNHTGYAIWWGQQDHGGLGYDSDNGYFVTTERGTSSSDTYESVIFMNLSDGTLIKRLLSDGLNYRYKSAMNLDENLWYIGEQSGTVYVYDAVNDTVYPTNAIVDDTRSFFISAGNGVAYTDKETGLVFTRRQIIGGMGCYYNPCFLATINNISQPVTKNATQTMKVTYTLTEE